MTDTATLTRLERMALEGLEARQRLLSYEQTALNEAFAELKETLEQRMGLDPGALGSTHQLNPETLAVEPTSTGDVQGDALDPQANAAANGTEIA